VTESYVMWRDCHYKL